MYNSRLSSVYLLSVQCIKCRLCSLQNNCLQFTSVDCSLYKCTMYKFIMHKCIVYKCIVCSCDVIIARGPIDPTACSCITLLLSLHFWGDKGANISSFRVLSIYCQCQVCIKQFVVQCAVCSIQCAVCSAFITI